MKYFITKDENDNAFVVTPVPAIAATYSEFKLFLDVIPQLPSGHKYIISNGELTTTAESAAETLARTENENESAYRAVDLETKESLKEGFDYDSKTFPLDQDSQNLYMRLYLKSQAATYQDQNIPTIDHDVYTLVSANVTAFFAAYHSAATSINEDAREAKASATT